MRSLIVAGLAASLAAFTVATPAFANPPDLMLKPGNAPAAGASSAYGGGFRGGQGGGVRNFGGGGGGGRHFGGGYGGGGYGGGGYGGGGYRRHHGYGGAAVGAGIAGLAAGALIGGAIANQQPAYGYGDGYDYGYAAPAPVYVDPGPVYSEGDVVDEVAPVSGDQTAYCEGRYRSYDPRSGTYLGFDGARHPCP